MINKSVATLAEAVAVIPDGASIMIGGFGPADQPLELIDALIESGARGLTVISNNAGNGDSGLAALLKAGRVDKMICSFPRQVDSWYSMNAIVVERLNWSWCRRATLPPGCRPQAAV